MTAPEHDPAEMEWAQILSGVWLMPDDGLPMPLEGTPIADMPVRWEGDDS